LAVALGLALAGPAARGDTLYLTSADSVLVPTLYETTYPPTSYVLPTSYVVPTTYVVPTSYVVPTTYATTSYYTVRRTGLMERIFRPRSYGVGVATAAYV